MTSSIKQFMEQVELFSVEEVELITHGDFFYKGKKPNIIYIAYLGEDDQGQPQLRKRTIYHANNKKQVGKTSKMFATGTCQVASNKPQPVLLSSLKKDRLFIVFCSSRYLETKYFPVGKVHRISKTSKWQIELLHCFDRYVKMEKHNFVIPL